MTMLLSPPLSVAFSRAMSPYPSTNGRTSAALALQNPSRFNPLSSFCFSSSSSTFKRSLSRNYFRVWATRLQEEEEEKVVVEESFQFKDVGKGNHKGMPLENQDATSFEMRVIKFEHAFNVFLTDTVIKVLDTFYEGRHYPRFYVLENIARVPYFAFISVLHLYESFGWWRRADYLQELGGNAWWLDRVVAQSIAFVYYFVAVFMYMISPRMAYHFSECVEHHAYETYDKYIKAYGEELKNLPPAEIAVRYYTQGDLYLFDEFQTSRQPHSRRPKIENLYDVFLNIRDDEAEHCKTMKACQTHGNLRSPHSSMEDEEEEDQSGCVAPQDCEGIVDCIQKSVTSPPAKGR
ncbi:hypothetical protein V2J09_021065 [Rumex salicifolius]